MKLFTAEARRRGGERTSQKSKGKRQKAEVKRQKLKAPLRMPFTGIIIRENH
jgi:hypothetical protein